MARKPSRRQLALIHVAKAKLGLSDREYRQALMHFGDVESAKELMPEGFDAMMGYFEWLGFAPVSPPPLKHEPGERDGFATPAQIGFIRDLWRRWNGEWDEGLSSWLERSFGVSDLRFLTSDGAQKAITALRAMNARAKAKAK